jgi:hypothetical protein
VICGKVEQLVFRIAATGQYGVRVYVIPHISPAEKSTDHFRHGVIDMQQRTLTDPTLRQAG